MVIILNNLCGIMCEGLGLGDKGMIVYDLVYYWLIYVFIISLFDFDVMLFILFKCIGYVGLCIGCVFWIFYLLNLVNIYVNNYDFNVLKWWWCKLSSLLILYVGG